jgi:hypothetical protein
MTMAKSHVNKLLRLRNFRPVFATIVDNPGITPRNARTIGWTSPIHRGKTPSKNHHNKKPNIQVKQGQRDFMGIVSTREHLSL